jgi:hypothetical protein
MDTEFLLNTNLEKLYNDIKRKIYQQISYDIDKKQKFRTIVQKLCFKIANKNMVGLEEKNKLAVETIPVFLIDRIINTKNRKNTSDFMKPLVVSDTRLLQRESFSNKINNETVNVIDSAMNSFLEQNNFQTIGELETTTSILNGKSDFLSKPNENTENNTDTIIEPFETSDNSDINATANIIEPFETGDSSNINATANIIEPFETDDNSDINATANIIEMFENGDSSDINDTKNVIEPFQTDDSSDTNELNFQNQKVSLEEQAKIIIDLALTQGNAAHESNYHKYFGYVRTEADGDSMAANTNAILKHIPVNLHTAPNFGERNYIDLYLEDFFIHKIIGKHPKEPPGTSRIIFEHLHNIVITFHGFGKGNNTIDGLYSNNSNFTGNDLKLIIPNDSFGNNDMAEGAGDGVEQGPGLTGGVLIDTIHYKPKSFYIGTLKNSAINPSFQISINGTFTSPTDHNSITGGNQFVHMIADGHRARCCLTIMAKSRKISFN